VSALNDLNLNDNELQIVWLSLLCAGKGKIPNQVDYGNRVELTDEAQVTARELAKRVRALMAEVQPTTK
jgi:hypothetical protein